MSGGHIPLDASYSRIPAGSRTTSDPDPSTHIEAMILVRGRSGSKVSERVDAILRGEAPALSREEAASSMGTDPEDLDRVTAFAAAQGLAVIEVSPARRSVRVSATVARMEAAFGTRLRSCEIAGRVYICYEGALSIPAELAGIIRAVLGLDQRPVARR